jgi:cytochrome c-type biogenesis protein CcmH
MTQDIAALKRQLQQLQELHASGTLGEAAYAEARGRLEREIVDRVMAGETPAAATPATPAETAGARGPRPSRRLLAALGVGIVALAVVGYRWTGSPSLALSSAAAPAAPAAPGSEAAPHALGSDQIAAMVDRLAERLKERPDDAEGWAMLGRSYVALGQHEKAVPAFEKATALRPDDAVLLADHADALAVRNGRSLAGEPIQLVQRALKADPRNLKALALAGTEAFDRADYPAAAAYWQRLVDAAPPDSPFVAPAREGLAEARQRGGLPAPKAEASPPMPAAPGGAVLSGTVTLAPALRAKAAPEDTVFVFARAAEGPRMPLAILRRQVKDLPLQFKLDDSLAMSPAARLSGASRVVVGARVSKSGDAMPQPGDLSGQTAPVSVGAQGLTIEISQVVGAGSAP